MTEKDKQIRSILKGSFAESLPAADFTEKIISKIGESEISAKPAAFEYKPLISRLGWAMIALFLLGVILLGVSGDMQPDIAISNYVPDWNFDISIIYSPLASFAAVSMLTMLLLDHAYVKRSKST